MEYLFYAETAILSALVLCMLLFRTKIITKNSAESRPLRVLIISTISFSSLDTLLGILITIPGTNQSLIFIFSTLFYASAAVLSYSWICRTNEYMFHEKNSLLTFAGLIPLIAEFIILIINAETGFCFKMDSVEGLVRGKHDWVVFFPLTVFFIFTVIRMHFWETREKDVHRKHLFIGVTLASAFPLFGMLCQYLEPFKPFISATFMLGCLLLFCYNVTSEHDYVLNEKQKTNELRHNAVINGLSDDFSCIYYIDIRTGEAINYRINELFNDIIPNWTTIDNFFERAKLMAKYVVYEKDVNDYLENGKVENIMADLDEGRPHYINYRINIDGNIKYYQNKFVRNSSCETEYHVVVGCHDITEQIRHEIVEREKAEEILKSEMENKKLLNEAMQKAEEANDAKSRFLFSMSHDLRTPMNAILGFTELAKKNITNSQTVEDCLSKVSIAGNQLLQLINDVLDMSRIECGRVVIEKSPANLITLADNFKIMVSDAAQKKNITLTVNCEEIKNDIVRIDTLRVNQVALNIIHNAIKYTPAGGKVDVFIRQTSKVIDNYADYSLIVSDNGIGISSEFLGQVYEAFAREHNSTVSKIEGTGLGLAITKNLMDLMGADIDIQSTQGVGTTVTCSFTLEVLDGRALAPEPAPTDDIDINGKRILVVEDNELNREIACGILEDFGLEVESADDGSVAVSKFSVNDENYYDFILMDIQMPFMDGYHATQEIRNLEKKTGHHIPIIALTANAFEDDRKKAFEAGMDAHVSKPINSQLLIKVLRELSVQ